MRLIDADNAVIYIRNHILDAKEKYSLLEFLKNCPTIAPESPQWISVKDRTPQENGVYLVNVHQEDEVIGCGDAVLLAWYQKNDLISVPSNIGWALLNEFYEFSDSLRDDITHWMPLPEPPEGDA